MHKIGDEYKEFLGDEGSSESDYEPWNKATPQQQRSNVLIKYASQLRFMASELKSSNVPATIIASMENLANQINAEAVKR